tara:strand:- start:1982 stop:2269 length:288 start_codon:yes stop_codon:yes gene_type:complete
MIHKDRISKQSKAEKNSVGLGDRGYYYNFEIEISNQNYPNQNFQNRKMRLIINTLCGKLAILLGFLLHRSASAITKRAVSNNNVNICLPSLLPQA